MTVIAWDGHTLAADKRSTEGGMVRTTTKIVRAPDGSLVAGTGNTSVCREMRQWYIEGADKTKWPAKADEASLLVVTVDGRVLYYWDGPAPVHIEDTFVAIGSGSDFATVAMHLGKTAREAVELACRFSNACGNGIDTLELAPDNPQA